MRLAERLGEDRSMSKEGLPLHGQETLSQELSTGKLTPAHFVFRMKACPCGKQ